MLNTHSHFETIQIGIPEALNLVNLQEMDYVQAAAILKVPLGPLKSRLARTRIQVRVKLQENYLP